jgi:hypothetical protein
MHDPGLKKYWRAFLPDDVLGRSFVFRILRWVFFIPFAEWFWSFSVQGFTEVKQLAEVQGKGVLFILRHSTHNSDIWLTCLAAYDHCG